MESYVSSITGPVKGDRNVSVVQQEAINASVKQLNEVVDSYVEDKTEQCYGCICYCGPFQSVMTFDIPQTTTPVFANIGYDRVYLGNLDSCGSLSVRDDVLVPVTSCNTAVTIVQNIPVTNSFCNVPPVTTSKLICTFTCDTDYVENGVSVKRHDDIVRCQITVVDKRCDRSRQYSDYTCVRWYWDGCVVTYDTSCYCVTKDYTAACISIDQKYLKA